MNSRSLRLALRTTVVWLLLVPLPAAGQSPPIMGHYDLPILIEDGDDTRVRLVVKLLNRGVDSFQDAEVVLEEALPPHRTLGSFTEVILPAREAVVLDGSFDLPEAEQEHWNRGGSPRLFLVQRKDGAPVRLRIELTRRPFLMEEQP